MPERIVRAPDIPGNRKGNAAPSQEPAGASAGSAGRPGTNPATEPGAAEEVPTLASPTLAALYASQGHREMAAAIYARLGQGGGQSPPGKLPGSVGPGAEVPAALVEKLLALRRAARRRRVQIGAGHPPPDGEECADGH